MVKHLNAGLAAAAFTVGSLSAAPAWLVRAVDEAYQGTYKIEGTFTAENNGSGFLHGLSLPGFKGGVSWSVVSGVAGFHGDTLDLTGQVSKMVGGTEYALDFAFSVTKQQMHPKGLFVAAVAGLEHVRASRAALGRQASSILIWSAARPWATITGSVGALFEGLCVDVERTR